MGGPVTSASSFFRVQLHILHFILPTFPWGQKAEISSRVLPPHLYKSGCPSHGGNTGPFQHLVPPKQQDHPHGCFCPFPLPPSAFSLFQPLKPRSGARIQVGASERSPWSGKNKDKPGTGGRREVVVLPPVPGLVHFLFLRGFRFAPPPATFFRRFAARTVIRLL